MFLSAAGKKINEERSLCNNYHSRPLALLYNNFPTVTRSFRRFDLLILFQLGWNAIFFRRNCTRIFSEVLHENKNVIYKFGTCIKAWDQDQAFKIWIFIWILCQFPGFIRVGSWTMRKVPNICTVWLRRFIFFTQLYQFCWSGFTWMISRDGFLDNAGEISSAFS